MLWFKHKYPEKNKNLTEVSPSDKLEAIKKTTLGELSESGHTYWKFSQSRSGLSSEPTIYLPYVEENFSTAQDEKKLLSFVTEQYIAKCYMYGDQLTKLCFDKQNPNFQKIQNNSYKYIGGAFGEYETSTLYVEKIYSLKNKSTIRLLASMIPDKDCILATGWFSNPLCDSFEKKLEKYEFVDSAKLLSKIEILVQENIHMKKKELLTFIDSYKDF